MPLMIGRSHHLRWRVRLTVRQTACFTSRAVLPSTASKATDREPLRILFCGGDAFSVPSLRALHDESQSGASNILSIDVVTKKDQRVGRGGRDIYTPPLKPVGHDLGLPVHQIDTFTGWSPPEYMTARAPYINLVVAVSFGLKVPPRILNQCKYGGLNVHPSMLPGLRGAAPIHWSIINGLTYTGISVQTLHPTQFDNGVVLSQTPQPGIAIPDPSTCSYAQLRDFLAPIGAEMLVKAIRSGLHEPPYEDVTGKEASMAVTFAPKITNKMREIDFETLNCQEILRRNRATSPLWAVAETPHLKRKHVRIIFGKEIRQATVSDMDQEFLVITKGAQLGKPFAVIRDGEDIYSTTAPLFIRTIDNSYICVPTLVVAGSPVQPAAVAAARGHLFAEPRKMGANKLYIFHRPLQKVGSGVDPMQYPAT